MLSLYAIVFLAAISGISTAAPTTIDIPEGQIKGSLSCVEVDGEHIWKVAANVNSYGSYGHTEGDDVLKVKIDLTAATMGPVNIESVPEENNETRRPKKQHPYFGAVGMGIYGDPTMGPNRNSLAMLAATEGTQPGSLPTHAGNSVTDQHIESSFIESAIWRYEPITGELTPQWINPDGSLVDVFVLYQVESNGFMFTGNTRFARKKQYRKCRLIFNSIMDWPASPSVDDSQCQA